MRFREKKKYYSVLCLQIFSVTIRGFKLAKKSKLWRFLEIHDFNKVAITHNLHLLNKIGVLITVTEESKAKKINSFFLF